MNIGSDIEIRDPGNIRTSLIYGHPYHDPNHASDSFKLARTLSDWHVKNPLGCQGYRLEAQGESDSGPAESDSATRSRMDDAPSRIPGRRAAAGGRNKGPGIRPVQRHL